MSIHTFDTAPIAAAVEERKKAEEAIAHYGNELAAKIADQARQLGIVEALGTIELPRGYAVQVMYGDAKLQWPRPFLPTGEKLLRDIKEGWLDNVAAHLRSLASAAHKSAR